MKAYCHCDPARLKSIRAAFSAPSIPGDTIGPECWKVGDVVAFRARVPARDAVVLSHGRAVCLPA